jgi:hypothetical protein
MSALATAPKTYTPDSAGRQTYALTFASSVAHLFLDDGDLVCGMLGDRAKLGAQLWKDDRLPKLMDQGVLRELQPRPVLDLAGNLGWYARLAAVEGAEAIAADIDEACVNRLYRRLRLEEACVLPAVLDLNDPSPGHGVDNRRIPRATKRLHSNLLLTLVVTHRLVVSGFRVGSDQVVRCLSSFTRRALLVEFVRLDSPGCPYDRSSRPDANGWYDLDHLIGALRAEFRSVTVLQSLPKLRRLLLRER